MKITFYARTRDQINAATTFVQELNSSIQQKVGYSSARWVRLSTKFTKDNKMWDSIPKSKPGEKKYQVILRANKEKMDRIGINLYRSLEKLGFEVVYGGDGGVEKYKGEKTTEKIYIKTYAEFLTITSVFDKAFGQGQWKMVGPKKLRDLIKRVEAANERLRNSTTTHFPSYEKYKNGVPVRLVVKKPDADINKYLFKVKLKA